MHRILCAFTLLALGACTIQAHAPVVEGASLATVGAQQPGSYSALVQTGGWDMNTQVVGFTCSANNYTVDLNGSWDAAMRGALSAALQKVRFAPNAASPAELVRDGYDAQIGIMQSNASSKLAITSHFLGAEAVSDTQLEGVLIVTFPDGKVSQQPIDGHGVGSADVFLCTDAGPAIERSSAKAIGDIVQKATVTTKLLIAQHKPGEPVAVANPTSTPVASTARLAPAAAGTDLKSRGDHNDAGGGGR